MDFSNDHPLTSEYDPSVRETCGSRLQATLEFPPVATTAEVATFIRCSQPQVREYVREGRLRGFLAGRSLRFTRAAVERFIEDCEHRP